MHDDLPRRRSLRLRGYDYAQVGAYFVTICAYERRCLFGRVVEAQIFLSPIGEIVAREWAASAEMRRDVDLDASVISPITCMESCSSAEARRQLWHVLSGR